MSMIKMLLLVELLRERFYHLFFFYWSTGAQGAYDFPLSLSQYAFLAAVACTQKKMTSFD